MVLVGSGAGGEVHRKYPRAACTRLDTSFIPNGFHMSCVAGGITSLSVMLHPVLHQRCFLISSRDVNGHGGHRRHEQFVRKVILKKC